MRKKLFLSLGFLCTAVLIFYIAVSCEQSENVLSDSLRLKAASTIVVRARGTNGSEHIKVTVAGTQVGSWTLTTSYANYSCTTDGTGAINVYFDNDGSGRDVQIDYITVNGETRQAEAQATNTGAWNSAASICGGVSSEWLYCNGYIAFGDVGGGSSSSSGGSGAIVVRARGTNGSEHIKVTVGGTQVGSWTLTTSYANYSCTSDASGAINVVFDNDASGRDVQVDYITVDGETRQAEAQVTNTAVYQNGSCGGTLSEMMHCNGYIDFGDMSGGSTTISVSPATLSVAAAANSTGTFTVTSSTSWTVSSSQSWLAVDPTSGSNNGTVTVTAQQNTSTSPRTATVTVSGDGTSKTVTVTQSGAGGGGDCNVPAMPSYSSLPTNSYLPDPFKMMSGSRISTKAEWTCRRAEIAAQAMEWEYGYMPNTPYSATTGSKSGNSIVVTVTDNGHTISFSCSITYPSTGSAPYPAMIGCGGSSLNNSALSSLGVAVINFPNNDIAQQNDASSRGSGKFYTMYGSNHSAGALMAWAWGVDRLIDAIEKTPAANIDANRLGVTGCSRNGKGALACGAFCERIKLTIPQESGSGGAAGWRVSDWQMSQGQNVQTLSEIVGENCWFRQNFSQFSNTATKLPFDHHMIEGLCAPRALLVIENSSMEWLGNVSTWTTGNVAHKIWQALGVSDKMGYSSVGHSDHCGFPSVQQPEVTAYVQKFLVGGGTGNTNVMKCTSGVTYNESQWVNWTVPNLQ